MSGADLPNYQDFMLPVLSLIGEGRERLDQALPDLQKHFSLTDEQMERLLPSGKAYVADRAGWARTYLVKPGLVGKTGRARYALTPRGRAVLDGNPEKIGKNELLEYPEFQAWLSSSRNGNDTLVEPVAKAASEVGNATPEETMESAFAEIDSALSEDLLERVLSLTPARFERLIVDLLLAMGYGDGRAEMGQAIGRSGDGGIDGVVNEDKLGLDAVYIQAKRYAPDNPVSRPALQAFVGSMTGESATKGVFVTTSRFTKEAADYVRLVQQRVVLIDGARLARLMIDHGVGVRIDKTYVLRSIDANFFDVN